ncbi:transmembrane protein, putative [Medicago truncatula]|uniref:Transmembrane protein, putative n=1 Tax=Medicago truncatula TaxID=3880 RepID=A0A072UUA8_MEDTR|nr:transmembrane protein, putative [Medicago truncatula]
MGGSDNKETDWFGDDAAARLIASPESAATWWKKKLDYGVSLKGAAVKETCRERFSRLEPYIKFAWLDELSHAIACCQHWRTNKQLLIVNLIVGYVLKLGGYLLWLHKSIRDSSAEDHRGICKYRFWNSS